VTGATSVSAATTGSRSATSSFAAEVSAPDSGTLSGAAAETVASAVTRIYEACSFQDITGQRIGKVVAALKAIETRVAAVTAAFGRGDADAAPPPVEAEPTGRTEGERLANGPQLPAAASSQADVDRLLASFD
jgi:chemotaxis protein CheZ